MALIDLCIGAGQGGNRIALEISKLGIKTAYINLSKTDESGNIASFGNDRLIVDGAGTNRNPLLGLQIASKHKVEIQEFLKRYVNKNDRVLLCISGGGGSGAGSSTVILDTLLRFTKNINVLYTTPLKVEQLPETPNSIKNLNRIIPYAEKGVGVILVDNQKIADDLKIVNWDKINQYIAGSLFSCYNLSTLREGKDYVDFSSGFNALDEKEFLGTFYYGQGFIDIREVRISGNILKMQDQEISKSISTSSLLFGSYDARTTKTYVACIGYPEEYKTEPRIYEKTVSIFEAIKKLTKCNFSKQSSYFSPRIKNVKIDLLLTGLTQHKSMDKILHKAQSEIHKFKEKEKIGKINTEGLDY